MKNVLIILTDQLRKDTLGCYGNSICQTPNIDRLAERGVCFNRNYVANPICMPNRLSIFTGQYPRNHKMWTNGLYFNKARRTMATEFTQHGYQTAAFGKLHFTPYQGDSGDYESGKFWETQGNAHPWHGPYWGFEHVELTIGHTKPLAHYGRWFEANGGTPEMFVRRPISGAPQSGVRDMPPELHDSAFVGTRAASFLREQRNRERPFFAVASFPDPHHPFDPPEAVAQSYSPEEVNPPIGTPDDLNERPEHYRQHFQGGWHRSGPIEASRPQGIPENQQNEMIAHTYAMVDLIDRNVGIILDTLFEEGLAEETLVLFTSDHGELLGDYGLWFKGPFFYEGLINTPLIMAGMDCVPGMVSDALVSDVDLAPTLYDLTGVPKPFYIDGLSQKAHLLDPGQSVREHCLIEYHTGYGQHDQASKALVTADTKYIHHQSGELELTDLLNDPTEQYNLAASRSYQETLSQMQVAMLSELIGTESKWPEQIALA
ncbi:MAG: sulfatase-like hydrolase/transferase [Chloroflexota bacterium]